MRCLDGRSAVCVCATLDRPSIWRQICARALSRLWPFGLLLGLRMLFLWFLPEGFKRW